MADAGSEPVAWTYTLTADDIKHGQQAAGSLPGPWRSSWSDRFWIIVMPVAFVLYVILILAGVASYEPTLFGALAVVVALEGALLGIKPIVGARQRKVQAAASVDTMVTVNDDGVRLSGWAGTMMTYWSTYSRCLDTAEAFLLLGPSPDRPPVDLTILPKRNLSEADRTRLRSVIDRYGPSEEQASASAMETDQEPESDAAAQPAPRATDAVHEKAGAVTATFSLSEEDAKRGLKVARRFPELRTRARAYQLAGVVVGVAFVGYMLLVATRQVAFFWTVAVAFLVIMFVWRLTHPLGGVLAEHSATVTMSFDNDGVRLSSRYSASTRHWHALSDYQETPEAFVLLGKDVKGMPNYVNVLPKAALGSDDGVDRLRSLFEQHLDSTSASSSPQAHDHEA